MTDQSADILVRLLGPFSIADASGQDLTPRGRKAQALIAMLCTSVTGKRTRGWLQAHLWSDRAAQQASASLRSCIHEVRKTLGPFEDIVSADRSNVQIDLTRVSVDVLDIAPMDWLNTVSSGVEFLEGIDILDSEFNHWLTEQRLHWASKMEPVQSVPAAPAAPAPSVTDVKAAETPEWELSLCVLPLQNRSTAAQNAYVASGISDDISSALQRLRWLPIIHPSALTETIPDQESGRAAMVATMGAQYFVDGSVSEDQNGLLVRLQLFEAESRTLLWSDAFELRQVTSAQLAEKVMDDVVGVIERTVSRAFSRRVQKAKPRSGDFLDSIWRGRWHLSRLTREDSEQAKMHLTNALALQPNEPEGLILMGFWHLWRNWVSRDEGFGAAETFARQAMELDPEDGRCYALLGIADAWRRNHYSAFTLLEQALDLNPNLAIAHHQLGSALLHADKPEQALGPLSMAIRHSPRDQLDFAFQTEMAVALARTGAHEAAYVHATRALMTKPRYWYGHLVRIVVAEQLGDPDRIAEARRSFDRAELSFTPKAIDWLPFESQDWPDQLRRAIR